MSAVRAITCPSCGGSIEVRAAGYTVTLACQHCGSLLDVSRAEVQVIKAYRRAGRSFAIAPGARGTLFDVEWEAVGALKRHSEESGEWQEFLLFNPYAGYRWLVAAGGEWQFGTMLLDLPQDDGGAVSWRGHHYALDSNETAATTMVLGEFYWRVVRGDSAQCSTFAGCDGTLSREVVADEVTWTHLVPVDAAWVEGAFAVDRKFVPQAAEPSLKDAYAQAPGMDDNDLPMMFLVALAALLMIGLVQDLLSGPRVCAQSHTAMVVGAATTTHRIGTIDVRRPWQFVTIEADSDSFTNRWVDLDYSLVNRATQQSIDAYGIVEFYTGTDSDGPWTEGSHHAATQFARVPRGSYDVYVDTAAHGWPSDPAGGVTDPANPWAAPETVAMWFSACTGGSSWGMFWLMAVLLFAGPAMILWWRHRD